MHFISFLLFFFSSSNSLSAIISLSAWVGRRGVLSISILRIGSGKNKRKTKYKYEPNSAERPAAVFFVVFSSLLYSQVEALLSNFIFFFLRSFPSYLHYIIEGCVVLLLLLLLWTGWSGSRCCHEWENSSCTSFGRCCSGSDRRIPATCYCPHFAGRMPFDSGAIRFVTWNQFFQSFIQYFSILWIDYW